MSPLNPEALVYQFDTESHDKIVDVAIAKENPNELIVLYAHNYYERWLKQEKQIVERVFCDEENCILYSG